MTDSWRRLADKYGHTVEEVKELLPIEWVVAIAAGVHLTEHGEGRSHGLCPFHSDETPSFDVYGYGERWGCFPCGRGGDVFDFIGDYWDLTEFPARFERSLELLQTFEGEASDWKGIIDRAEPPKPVTVAELSKEVEASWEVIKRETTQPVIDLLERKGIREIDLPWLRKTWKLGVNTSMEVVAPHWDTEGKLVTYKTRRPDRGGWYARRGGKLTSLYGEWQLEGKDAEADVWLCEGETDTWWASWLVRGRGIALGLPSGAGSTIRPEWVELMRDRRVTLVFDNDTSGRRAAERWWTQLNGLAREVSITFPETDLCEARNPMEVLESGQIVTEVSGFVIARPDGRAYQQMTRQGAAGEMLSNWVLVPTKHVSYLDTHGVKALDGFEGYFRDETRKRVRVTEMDFRTAQTLTEWSNRNGRVWYGSQRKHVQAVLDTMKTEIPFLKRETAVSVAGLWGEDTSHPVFVLPEEAGGTIGSAQGAELWTYEGGFSHVEIGSRYSLWPSRPSLSRDEAREILKALLKMNHPSVTTPLLAWLAAAPLRKLFGEFPPMGVFGDSGSGKTAMLMAVMRLFYGWRGPEQNLTRTTPHGVIMQSAGTNGLPVWWDEYRRGGRRDTFSAMSQLIRDSWTGSVSQRGGMGDNLSRIEQTAAIAPLLLSGEAALEERSTIDRVVVVRLSKGGAGDLRSETALESALDLAGRDGGGRLGRDLIEWQLGNLDGLRASLPEVRDRQEHGLAVLSWSWDRLVEMAEELWGITMKWELDLSRVTAQREDTAENPEVEALVEALSLGAFEHSGDAVPVAWVEDPGREGAPSVVGLRPRAFYQWATKRGYVLPGGERATKQLLMGRYGWLTKDKADYRGPGGIVQKRVNAVRLRGVLEAEEAEVREAQVRDLERRIGEVD